MRIAILILSALAAQPAAALSCLRPSLESSFAAADAAPEAYVIGRGSLTLAPGQAPPPMLRPNQSRAPVTLNAQFDGQLASCTGFDHPADMPVELVITCAGPWCGVVPQGTVIAFLERRGAGPHRLTLGPCPQFALAPHPDAEARVLACLAQGCAPD